VVVSLVKARKQKRAGRYLPLWVFGFGLLFALAFLNTNPGIVGKVSGMAADLLSNATTSVDHTLSSPQTVYFSQCHSGGGVNCVVDGDTFWMAGVKIRVSDIDAPETHPSRCSREADLGERATNRLQALLNAGPVELRAGSRDEDVYGRKLRIISRDGQSLGMRLVSEGLARAWDGAKRPWC
jgi:endonuclease YncB( thermonuclease family)